MEKKNIHIQRLINARKSKGISVYQLANLLNTSNVNIYHWEAGRFKPNYLDFIRWNQILGIKTIEL